MHASFFAAAVSVVVGSIGCATAQTEDSVPFDAHLLDARNDGAPTTDALDSIAVDSSSIDSHLADGAAETSVAETDVDSTADSSIDSGIDSTTIDTAPDSAPIDTGFDAPTDAPVTTVTFPSTTSTTYTSGSGTGTLGSGGGGVHYVSGDYCEQAFTRSSPVTKLDLSFRMSDLTTGCSTGTALSWDVKLNGTKVGSYSFTSASAFGDRTIAQSYTFASIAPVAGAFTIRLQATSTVCSGGSSWNWYPGGAATMQ